VRVHQALRTRLFRFARFHAALLPRARTPAQPTSHLLSAVSGVICVPACLVRGRMLLWRRLHACMQRACVALPRAHVHVAETRARAPANARCAPAGGGAAPAGVWHSAHGHVVIRGAFACHAAVPRPVCRTPGTHGCASERTTALLWLHVRKHDTRDTSCNL
jgi:hypothetical protein